MPPFYFDEEEIIDKPKKKKKKSVSRNRTNVDILTEESGCDFCDLKNHCLSPMMNPYGNNELNIMIVGEAPGKTEDEKGKPFKGSSGKLLRSYFEGMDIYIDDDCLVTNVLQCRPKNNVFPTNNVVKLCFPRLRDQIFETKPTIIYAIGGKAIKSLLFDSPKSIGNIASTMWGKAVPSMTWKCWVVCCYHPSYINRLKNAEKKSNVKFKDVNKIFKKQLQLGLEYYDKELPEVLV